MNPKPIITEREILNQISMTLAAVDQAAKECREIMEARAAANREGRP